MEIKVEMIIACSVIVIISSVLYVLGGILGLREVTKKTRKQQRRMKVNGNSTEPEVIIVGSGVLGSTMATVLARDGRRVTVIERDMKEPDRIVGELFQPGGIRTLEDLGLGDCASGFEEVRLDGFVIHDPFINKPIDFQYPKGEADKIQSARCFHHGRFIMSLRKAAMAEKNVTYIEGTVTTIIEEKGRVVGVEYKKKGEQEKKTLLAPLTVVADGTFSKFRKQFSMASHEKMKTPTSYFIGFKLKETYDLKANHAEGFWCQSTPTIMYRICPDTIRLMADIETSVQPKNPKQFVMDTLYPDLPDHLKKVVGPAMEDDGVRLRLVPTYYVPSAPLQKPGTLLLGDALNCRHPYTASGMTVALMDIKTWADILQGIDSLDDKEIMAEAINEFQKRRRAGYALVINVFAQCVKTVLFATDRYLSKFRLGAYNYVLLGGECLNGPLRIYGCLEPRPALLLYHFLAVNLYTAYYLLKSAPWYAKPIALLDGPLVFIRSSYMFFSLWLSECKSVTYQ
ncbi:squalene monooxygenase-like [Lytechinus pictus]|uniref:squalene monooxygenase-like n=1 Tax=Lytechinus pictus TaxID=7653 RepID=UPI0030B9FE2E